MTLRKYRMMGRLHRLIQSSGGARADLVVGSVILVSTNGLLMISASGYSTGLDYCPASSFRTKNEPVMPFGSSFRGVQAVSQEPKAIAADRGVPMGWRPRSGEARRALVLGKACLLPCEVLCYGASPSERVTAIIAPCRAFGFTWAPRTGSR